MFYTHETLDRADHLRRDAEQLAAMESAATSVFLPVWRGKMLVHGAENEPMKIAFIDKNPKLDKSENSLFLGLVNNKAIFAVSVSSLEENALSGVLSQALTVQPDAKNLRFGDLRIGGPTMAAEDGALMAYARGMIHWHDTVQFCARCGYKLHSKNGGHIKVCDNNACEYQSFPRTDPAVIMLVTKPATATEPEMSLLGRSPAWPQGVFSTLAGFVETGESLEGAVKREVFEEAGVSVDNVRYIASQPWPFPRSIMLGFEATAISSTIKRDPIELEDAQWFSREQLKQFGTWGDETVEFQLPRNDSIARFLINRWIEAV